MFDQLTPAERSILVVKLHHAGHAFFESATAIAHTALYLEEIGRISALSDEWGGLWGTRQPLVDAMDEMHDLMAEVNDFARAARA